MAIRVLLDHHIPASQILFVTFVVTPQSLLAVHAAFPGVRVITASVDRTVEKVSHKIRSSSTTGLGGRRSVSWGRVKPPVPGFGEGEREGRKGKGDEGEQGGSDMQRVRVEEEWVVKPGFGDIGDRWVFPSFAEVSS